MFFFDPTFIIVIIGTIICLIASANVKMTYNKFNKYNSKSGISASEAAKRILRIGDVIDVDVVKTRGELTDHYDPRAGEIRLSENVADSISVAAIGVAAHECGHAIQHEKNYLPLKIRSVIIPVVNIGSSLSWPLILIGALFGLGNLVDIGIILFSTILIFQLVTLPVEFNASRRAMKILKESEILMDDELKGARKVLTAAALTYVTSVIFSMLQLARLLILFGGRRRK